MPLKRDPRNISPTVGTGGNPGGPTGLFTIYDGQTLHRGEFTFSLAYSDFDRDPGNVDITEVPASFQVGLNDSLELFFDTDASRGIKVNNPLNLSGFYLPNSQPFGPSRGSAPAVVLTPSGTNVGTISNLGAVFRPAGNQPFVQFPYSGGSAGSFGQGPGGLGTLFGFPGFNATLGPARANGGHFSGAGFFPGIGSPIGGILPGIVLATSTLPATLLNTPITVPAVYTTAPSYLPDAPFINRQYGNSAFSTFTVGAKLLLTKPNNPLSVAVVPFYRFYADKANDLSGFNQLQRGASPGGSIGDFGLIGIVSGRLSSSVNISANFGYILNSSPKGKFPNGEFVLLDRPNEIQAGIGFDFPINRFFQPIVEVKSTQYVGSHTQNAFGNNPVEALAGFKLYPRSWFGFGFWYRYHINQQDLSSFKPQNFNTPVTQLTNVAVPGGGLIVVAGTTVPATAGGFPRGFVPSDDANGFGFQIFAGHRNAHKDMETEKSFGIRLIRSRSSVTVTCPNYQAGNIEKSDEGKLTIAAEITDATDVAPTMLFDWRVAAGRIEGTGKEVVWDLAGVAPGMYTATVRVDDGCGCVRECSIDITVLEKKYEPICPIITIEESKDNAPNGVKILNVTAGELGPGNSLSKPKWSVVEGGGAFISGGADQNTVTVDISKVACETSVKVRYTVTVQACGQTIECTKDFSFQTPPCSKTCTQFDAYEDLHFNDEKARLDNFAIRLSSAGLGSFGYIIAFDGSTNDNIDLNFGPRKKVVTGQIDPAYRAGRAFIYLTQARGIRVDMLELKRGIDGLLEPSTPAQSRLTKGKSAVTLYVCEQGAETTPKIGDQIIRLSTLESLRKP